MLGVPVISLVETGSTNAEAIAAAQSGAQPLPFWIRAQTQTGGRGRDGRAWVSLPGNLHATLALPLTCDLRVAPQLSLVTGLAVADALDAVAARAGGALPPLRLKWPNDIMAGTAKVGGILIETAALPAGGGLAAIAGIGLNVASAPDISGRDVASLATLGFRPDIDDMFQAVAAALDAALRLWDAGRGFDRIRERWLAAALPAGTAVSVHAGTRIVQGYFAGLDHDGALLLRDARGHLQRFTFGEVAL